VVVVVVVVAAVVTRVYCHSKSDKVKKKMNDTCILTVPRVMSLSEPEEMSLTEPANIPNVLRL
jgi:hypothetical protein